MLVYRNNQATLGQRVSLDFFLWEMRCHCGKCKITILSLRLLHLNQKVRTVWGKPYTPTSCYRCQAHNRSEEVGGADYSGHMSGHSVDIPLPNNKEEAQELVDIVASIFPYHYQGDGFVHAGTRG